MKIAISGAHFTGKIALVDELICLLRSYKILEEPYHLLEEEGYEFCDSPSIEDYERQLGQVVLHQ